MHGKFRLLLTYFLFILTFVAIDTCELKVENCHKGVFQIPMLLTEHPPPARFTEMFSLRVWKPANAGVEPGYLVTAQEANKRKEVNKLGGGRDRLSYQRL